MKRNLRNIKEHKSIYDNGTKVLDDMIKELDIVCDNLDNNHINFNKEEIRKRTDISYLNLSRMQSVHDELMLSSFSLDGDFNYEYEFHDKVLLKYFFSNWSKMKKPYRGFRTNLINSVVNEAFKSDIINKEEITYKSLVEAEMNHNFVLEWDGNFGLVSVINELNNDGYTFSALVLCPITNDDIYKNCSFVYPLKDNMSDQFMMLSSIYDEISIMEDEARYFDKEATITMINLIRREIDDKLHPVDVNALMEANKREYYLPISVASDVIWFMDYACKEASRPLSHFFKRSVFDNHYYHRQLDLDGPIIGDSGLEFYPKYKRDNANRNLLYYLNYNIYTWCKESNQVYKFNKDDITKFAALGIDKLNTDLTLNKISALPFKSFCIEFDDDNVAFINLTQGHAVTDNYKYLNLPKHNLLIITLCTDNNEIKIDYSSLYSPSYKEMIDEGYSKDDAVEPLNFAYRHIVYDLDESTKFSDILYYKDSYSAIEAKFLKYAELAAFMTIYLSDKNTIRISPNTQHSDRNKKKKKGDIQKWDCTIRHNITFKSVSDNNSDIINHNGKKFPNRNRPKEHHRAGHFRHWVDKKGEDRVSWVRETTINKGTNGGQLPVVVSDVSKGKEK